MPQIHPDTDKTLAAAAMDLSTANLRRLAEWCDEAVRYFHNRPIDGEDMAHWSNVSNATAAARIGIALRGMAERIERNVEVGGSPKAFIAPDAECVKQAALHEIGSPVSAGKLHSEAQSAFDQPATTTEGLDAYFDKRWCFLAQDDVRGVPLLTTLLYTISGGDHERFLLAIEFLRHAFHAGAAMALSPVRSK